jgi:hypothetical protein
MTRGDRIRVKWMTEAWKNTPMDDDERKGMLLSRHVEEDGKVWWNCCDRHGMGQFSVDETDLVLDM